MTTEHRIFYTSSNSLKEIADNSIELIVTSPPYPMIEMWDKQFFDINPEIEKEFNSLNSNNVFELMHKEIDKTWSELFRVLKDGGIACINIGDATRSFNGKFQLFNNHSRIVNHCLKIGFSSLPVILWRKQTNAPNKFMGSGMLPPNAYVTLEHEYVLIFRKGNIRKFVSEDEKKLRRESAIFWEERNIWFSDVWDLKGTKQKLKSKITRNRSAAFPFELAYRLINMFSIKGDTVLDPFLGTGTTMFAAMSGMRNSIGIEIDSRLKDIITSKLDNLKDEANEYISERIEKHKAFISNYKKKKAPKYKNLNYDFEVITKQEKEIIHNSLYEVGIINDELFKCTYN